MQKNLVISKKSSTFARFFALNPQLGSPKILIFWESVAQYGALYKCEARSHASISASEEVPSYNG